MAIRQRANTAAFPVQSDSFAAATTPAAAECVFGSGGFEAAAVAAARRSSSAFGVSTYVVSAPTTSAKNWTSVAVRRIGDGQQSDSGWTWDWVFYCLQCLADTVRPRQGQSTSPAAPEPEPEPDQERRR